MEATGQQMMSHAHRRNAPMAIIMLNLDHFKVVNDTYGRDVGDLVLRTFGELLRHSFRGEDVACRYGGEEFLLILPDAPLHAARACAESLLGNIRALRIPIGATTLSITASIGVAAWPEHGEQIHIVIKAADTAVYQAKQRGRNQVVVADIPGSRREDADTT
jgi:diguanylate cyclase (GGDEF)-like protein